MKELTEPIIRSLSLLTVLADILIVVLIITLVLVRRKKISKTSPISNLLKYFGQKAIMFSFILGLLSMTGSLFFSDVAGFAPCVLCWYQRILMYPLPLLFGISLIKRDEGIIDYGIAMSGIGALIAFYHYILQINPNQFAPCETIGYSVSCTQSFFMRFGYVTVPVMSLTAFALIFFMLIAKKTMK